jgi:serine/threonine-protein kinase RsbW
LATPKPFLEDMADHQSGASRSVDTVLESTLDSVDAAESLVLELAQQSGFEEEDLHKIGMAVREAMVNAVVHGNRYNLKKKVHFSLRFEGGKMQIVIADEGDGFEPAELPDPLAEENLLRQSGRGLLLIKAFVDEFSMRKAPPLGTEVRLAFHTEHKEEAGGNQ